MVAGEVAGCGRRSGVGHERTLRMGVWGKMQSVLVGVAVEDHSCLLEEVGVARLHVLVADLGIGSLAVTGLFGLGWEEGGQSGLVEVEGSEQRD